MDASKLPKISIITPNFNGAKYLEQTILSVLNQNYPNLEYIIIDGESTDGSVEIIKKYESKLSYWVSEQDSGLYHAIQKGFDKSTGEIMAWINSDDMYAKGGFSIVSEVFLNFNQVNWLVGIPSAYDEKGRTIRIDNFKRWSKFNYYTNDFKWIQQESVFWRRCLWEKAGSKVSTNLKYAGDFELWLRFFRYEKLYTLQSLLSGFRIRSSNQLSLEFMDDYLKEVDNLLQNEVAYKISQKDKKVVEKILKYKKIGDKSHHLIRFFTNYNLKLIIKKHYNYPKLLVFDRIKQCFKFSSN
ncbi:glycosyltransferase family 2 protein [Lutibacter sp. TH_r2]|uniref:glycosyltransferase family 2 protein n=1 Tax=Lutibacter sp. TH_r2 TaxID=3082083 RepID=UPI002955D46E|nr:glycosyltransferase family 2 protein [Lutibacter sp. TH_r2]MDV7187441.1 glycosyltransferase family 2 protein [Lutibacter sp. TH_r2]